MSKGHYIWNRVERVDKKNLPHVVVNAFNEWQSQESRHLEYLSEDKKRRVIYNINKQRKQMKENLYFLGYQVN